MRPFTRLTRVRAETTEYLDTNIEWDLNEMVDAGINRKNQNEWPETCREKIKCRIYDGVNRGIDWNESNDSNDKNK